MRTESYTIRRHSRLFLTLLALVLFGQSCFTSPNKVDVTTIQCQVADDCPTGYECKYSGRVGGCCEPNDLTCGVDIDASRPETSTPLSALDGPPADKGQQTETGFGLDGEIQAHDASIVDNSSMDLGMRDTAIGSSEEAGQPLDAPDAPITTQDEVGRILDAPTTGGSDTSDATSEAPCSSGGSCPVSNPCHMGILSCSTGTAVCVDSGNAADGTDCGNGNVCHNGTCSACVGGQACPIPGNPCQTGILTCTAGVSSCTDSGAKPDNTPCDDGNACTTGDVCSAGKCVGGPAPNCSDNNPCTDDSCNSATGCTHTNNTAPCNDGNACTTNDTCSGGACIGGAAPNCDDNNPCTTDTCNTTTGCAHTSNTLPCSDPSTPCLIGQTCSGGVCSGGSTKACPAPDLCHFVGTCNPSTGVCSNQAKTCIAQGVCYQAGTCNPSTGQCTNPMQPDNYPCDDQNGCTTNDVCYQGKCTGGAVMPCSDSQGPCYPSGNCNSTSSSTYTCVYPPPLPDGTTCYTGGNQGSCVTYQPTGFVQCLLL